MSKSSKILFVLTLALALLSAQVSALDIWGGSNSMIASPGATVEGGLEIGTDANELNYDLFAYSLVPAGVTGFAYSDWNIPTTQTATGSYTVDGVNHDFTVLYRGHVQTGVQKDSAPTVYAVGRDGDSYAEAHITAVAGVDAAEAKDVYGYADINAALQLSGESEGYAIADGLAGYSSASKVTGTSNDFTKVEGAAVGKVSLNGLGGVFAQGILPGNIRFTQLIGSADIYSEAGMITPLYAPDTYSYSEIFALGAIMYQGPGTVKPDGSTSLDWSAAGSANAKSWGSSSPVIKTESNANSLTDISDVGLTGMLDTYKSGDAVGSSAYITTDSNDYAIDANADLFTGAFAYREQADTANKASAESYMSGGNYKAVWKPITGAEYSVSGTIGWAGYLPGMASGAHLVSALIYDNSFLPFSAPDGVFSYSRLQQAAIPSDAPNLERTQANYNSFTSGPEYTNNINDDAGSYFSTSGYTTTSKEFDTYSTAAASYYDINWVNGKQVSTPRYGTAFSMVDIPVGSTAYDVRNQGGMTPSGGRYNDIGKELKQELL